MLGIDAVDEDEEGDVVGVVEVEVEVESRDGKRACIIWRVRTADILDDGRRF
jgi:hypothetical protein